MKTIAERNKAFAQISPARQRMTIARDVLKQLDAGKILAESGIYFDSNSLKLGGQNSQVQAGFLKMETCTVCAIGSLFVCGVLQGNALKVKDGQIHNIHISARTMREYLDRFFSREQQGLIESAFEAATIFAMDEGVGLKDARVAVRFGRMVNKLTTQIGSGAPKDEARLRAIMKNILKNRGTFRPEQLPTLQIAV